eukprot:ANDGO_08315.mRNA.1 Reticulocyte-binding protein 2 homolog a
MWKPLCALLLAVAFSSTIAIGYPLEPQPCPQGYYCPSSTGLPASYPCPSGTFSNVTGIWDVSQCKSCTPGMYCASSGLREPTGFCSAGYYCTGGSNSSTPSSAVCPPGAYCPTGSSAPLVCPAGTYNPFAGQYAQNDSCLPCSPGYYCPNANSTTDKYGVCSAGYVCVRGASSPTPNDGLTGYVCPIGYYCPANSAAPSGCPAGKYSPVQGKVSCDVCDTGRMCPFANMTATLPCQTGRYCPSGAVDGTPCPAGTFNNITGLSTSSDCFPCSTGFYCPTSGIIQPSLLCSSGHWCASGSVIPNPTTAGAYPSSNGLCPVGRYCTPGATSPTNCPAGTFSNVEGLSLASQCTACTAGKACTITGLTAPNVDCTAGWYCPAGQAVATPSAFICPPGHYCPTGSSLPIGCAPSLYQSSSNAVSCQTCTAGYYCSGNSSVPITCPLRFYCPAGTADPVVCPSGTVGNTTGLSSASGCFPCPSGKYCTDGQVTGDCAAGYICYFGNSQPNPPYVVGDSRGSLCPKGHYCLQGAQYPTQCTGNTVNAGVGGTTSSVCGPCPAGYICTAGDPVPSPCSPGYYCQFSSPVYACPVGTYNPVSGATNSTWCLSCPAGYYCPNNASVTYVNYPCPPGQYCPMGSSVPVLCPQGTNRTDENGMNVTSCGACPAGFVCASNGTVVATGCLGATYCPSGSSSPISCPAGSYCPALSSAPILCADGSYCPNATEYRIPCTGGTYCPAGAIYPITCPAGYYCPDRSTSPVPCPGSYYCTNGTSFPMYCPIGTYCPPLSWQPTLCPLGTYLNNGTSDRSSNSSCQACPKGTYGAAPDRSYCSACPAGYICYGSTIQEFPTDESLHKGRICKPGTYCPSGSYAELECPAGTYQPDSGKGSRSDCLNCKSGSYNPTTGQSSCLPCGSSSYSFEGATECKCNGTHRAFQEYDGSCICEPRYVFYSEELTVSQEDSSIDCQPIVFDRCTSLQARTHTGSCVADTYSCSKECVSGGGRINPNTGACECSELQDEDTVCDEACRAKQRLVYYDQSMKMLVQKDPVSGSYSSYNTSSMTGIVQCRSVGIGSSCGFLVTHMYSDGFRGVYDASFSYLDSLLIGKRNTSVAVSSTFMTHSVTVRDSSTLPSGIDQPVVCLKKGEGMLWSIPSDRTHYPVYEKDSLYNTNPNFDYGAFRQLKDQLKDPLTTIATFAFTFNDRGVYVFSDAASSSRLQIISVLDDNQDCPKDSRIGPLTASNLVSVGVRRSDNILLEPDWLLIAILLVGLLILIGGLIGGLYYFRSKSWGRDTLEDPAYRESALQHDFDKYASKGSATAKLPKYRFGGPNLTAADIPEVSREHMVTSSAVGAVAPLGMSSEVSKQKSAPEINDQNYDLEAFADDFWDFERQVDLEGFNASRVYETLDKHASQVQARLDASRGDAANVCERILEETENIKSLLGSRLGKKSRKQARILAPTGLGNEMWSVLPGGARELRPEDVIPVEEMKKALEDEMAAREVFIRRQRACTDDWDKSFAALKEARAQGASPEKIVQHMKTLERSTADARLLAEKERTRRLDSEEALREACGDDAVAALMSMDASRRESEERMLRHCEQAAAGLSAVADRLNDLEQQYKKGRKRCEARGDAEGVSKLDKEHSYDVAAVGRQLEESLDRFQRPQVQDLSELGWIDEWHRNVRNAADPLLEREHQAREREAAQTYDLPPEFTHAMSQFMAKMLHEMGLLTDVQAARVVAGDKEGTVLDPELLKSIVEAKKQGLSVVIGSGNAKDSQQNGDADATYSSAELDAKVQEEIRKLIADGQLDATRYSDAISLEQQAQLDSLERKLAHRRARMQERHSAERANLEDVLASEEREEFANLDEDLKSSAKSARSMLDRQMQLRLSAAGDDEYEKDRIMKEFQSASENLESALDSEARRQRSQLSQRLQERRKCLVDKLRDKQVSEAAIEETAARRERSSILQVEVAKSADESSEQAADTASVVSSVKDGAGRQSGAKKKPTVTKESLLHQRLEERHEHLAEVHDKEKRDLESMLLHEEEADRAAAEERLVIAKQSQEDALRRAAQEALNEASSEAEKERILKCLAEDVAAIDKNMSVEQRRQKELLEKRLSARKSKMRESLAKRQAAERDAELSEADQEVKHLLADASAANSKVNGSESSEGEGAGSQSVALAWEQQKGQIERQLASRVARKQQSFEAERAVLVEEIRKEEDIVLANIDSHIGNSYEQKRAELEQRLAAEMQRKGVHTDSEKKRLMETFSAELQSLEENLEIEREKQRADAKAALLKKKEEKERSLRKKKMEEEKRQIEEQEKSIRDLRLVQSDVSEGNDDAHVSAENDPLPAGLSGAISDIVTNAHENVSSDAERALQRQHARIIAEMEAQHVAEQEQVLSELESEMKKEADKELRRVEDQKKRQIAEEKAKLAAQTEQELASAQDETEASKIMEAHQKELEKLLEKVDSEKGRQAEELKRRLEEKKRKKVVELVSKQESEKRKEMAQQARETLDVKSKAAVESEKHAIEQAVAEGSISQEVIAQAIEVTMQQRHVAESQALSKAQADEKQRLLQSIRKVRQLLTAEELSALPDVEEDEQLLEMEVLHARSRLELRQHQLDEIATACAELSPQESMLKAQGIEAARRAADLRALQKKLEEDRADAKLKFETERRELERAQQEAIEKELRDLEDKFIQEQSRMEQEITAAREQKEKKMEAMRLQREAEMSAELQSATADQKNEIMQRYASEQARLESALDGERERQERAVREKLKKKQEEKLRIKKAAMEAELEKKKREEEEAERSRKEADRIAREREEARLAAEEEDRKRRDEEARREAERLRLETEEREKTIALEEEKRREEEQKLASSERLRLEAERQKQEESRKEQLELEKKTAEEERLRKIQAEKEMEEAKKRQDEAQKQKDEEVARQQAQEQAQAQAQENTAVVASGYSVVPADSSKMIMASGEWSTETDWFRSLMSSPLYSKLDEIDHRLSSIQMSHADHVKKRVKAASSLEEIAARLRRHQQQSLQTASASVAWTDEMDCAIAKRKDSTLRLTPPTDLEDSEAAAYNFGLDLCADALSRMGSPSVLIASLLPNSECETANGLPAANPLGHSYLYRGAEKTLFIHRDRLSDPGDFSMVVLHALSEISKSADGPKGEFHNLVSGIASRAYRKKLKRPTAVVDESSSTPGESLSDDAVRSLVSKYGGLDSDPHISQYLASLDEDHGSEKDVGAMSSLSDDESATDGIQGSVDLLAQLSIKVRTLERRLKESNSKEADLRNGEEELRQILQDPGIDAQEKDRRESELRQVTAEKFRVIQRVGMYNRELQNSRERISEIDRMSVAEKRLRNKDFFHELLASAPSANSPRSLHE